MCEILFLKKCKGKLKEGELRKLMEMGLGASRSNRDGFGVFNDEGKIYKRKGQFSKENAEELIKNYKGSKFVVFHLRNATEGSVSKKNAHPFLFKNFILCHNGIIYSGGSKWEKNKNKKDETDSFRLLKLIANNGKKTTVEKIKNSLKELSGSVSVFLLDPKGNLYYFRNSPRFSFAYIPTLSLIAGATHKEILKTLTSRKLLSFFEVERYKSHIQSPKSNIIYKIGKEIREVGSFETNFSYWIRKPKRHNVYFY